MSRTKDQVSFFGKYWILPDSRVINCTGDEHARYALAFLIGADPLNETQVHALVPTQAMFKARDSRGNIFDPRVTVILEHGWIRVAENKFYASFWGLERKRIVLDAQEFWKKQPGVTHDSWVELHEIISDYQPVTLVQEGPKSKVFAKLYT